MALTIAVMQTQGLWSWLNAVLVFLLAAAMIASMNFMSMQLVIFFFTCSSCGWLNESNIISHFMRKHTEMS